jgi:hypothetical protein
MSNVSGVLNRCIEIVKNHESRLKPLEAMAETQNTHGTSDELNSLKQLYSELNDKYNKLTELFTLNSLETLKLKQQFEDRTQIVPTVVNDNLQSEQHTDDENHDSSDEEETTV